jgi:hypothetical protein
MPIRAIRTVFAAVAMGIVWACHCFILWTAWLARTRYQLTQAQYDADMAGLMGKDQDAMLYSGRYLEAGSSIVTVLLGSLLLALILWSRGRVATSPHAATSIALIFQAALPLTSAVFRPYPYYRAGLITFLPFLVQHGINVVLTLLIFPENLNHRFCDLLIHAIAPLKRITANQNRMLDTDPASSEWRAFDTLQADHSAVTTALYALSRTQHLLGSEIAYCRLGPNDTSLVLQAIRHVGSTSAGFVKVRLFNVS